MTKTGQEIQLSRELGIFPVTSIVIANMIGAGIFTTSGLLMEQLGNSFVMLLLWISGGLLALCGALVYGELGAAMPRAGGEYFFLSRLFHPLAGFLSGWMSFIVGFSAPIAASAMGFSEYFSGALPGFTSPDFLSPAWKGKIIAISVIAGFTLVHLRGIKFGTTIQNFLTVIKISLIAALVVAGFSFGKGDMGRLVYEGADPGLGFADLKVAGLSLMWIMFSYSGWNASTYIGSEIKNPVQIIPRSLLLGTGIVILLYIAMNLFFIYAIPPSEMKGVVAIAGTAVNKTFGKTAGSVLSLLISFALFSSLSAFIIIGPRVYYSMAKDRCFFQFAGKVNPVHKVPSKAIILQSFIAVIMVVSGTFDQILTYMGFSLGIFPVLTVIAGIKLRLSGKGTLRLPGFPVTHAIYIVSGVTILVLAWLERPLESNIAIATMLTGIPAYFLFRSAAKRSGQDVNCD